MIPIEQAHLDVAAITHEGMSGKNNEDYYGISAYTLGEDTPTPVVFAIVADGIGGHQAGEVASEIAVETISAAIAESGTNNPVSTLRDAIVQASQRIHSQSAQLESMRGMGSTCACAWIIDDQLYTASVGDSRIYLIRDELIQQISTDHTWIQEALSYGIIKPEQVKGHPQAHVIRRYLGSNQPPEVDFRLRLHLKDDDQRALQRQGSKLLPGDQLILCSDGLTDLVSDDEIKLTMENNHAEAALQHLVDLANQRGGHDNITIISLQYPRNNAHPQTVKKNRMPLYGLAGATLALITIGVLSALAFFAWKMTRPQITATPTSSAVPIMEIITPPPETASVTQSAPPTTTATITLQSAQASYTPWPTSTRAAP
ncbi:MAG: serine/threonine-protein phosphatase [Chloroflexi bacterium]|nr:serine/threonine-protein phosphatase [Chloroflexota bacterium]